jgi:alpha-1,3-rhamnosyl/mannosyltransferase
VTVDARDLASDWRGIGRYVRAVVKRLVARDDLALTVLVSGVPTFARKRIAEAIDSLHFTTARAVPNDADVVWHPWNGTFFASDAPAVVTFHDAVPFAYPDADPKKRRDQQEPFRRSARTLALALVNSGYTAGQIREYLDVPQANTRWTPLGVDALFTPNAPPPAKPLADRPYILYVGAIEGPKNAAALALGHRLAFPAGDVALAFTRRAPLEAKSPIVFGSLDDARLADAYRGALAVCVPSLAEGFGLPALEAMACGTPVVVSRAGALPEVCGEAALYVEPTTAGEPWAEALRTIAGDAVVRATFRSRGIARAATFTWEHTAALTYDALADAAGRRRP